MLAAACSSADKPSVNASDISLSTRRFDRDLAALDTSNLAAGLQSLRQKYPDFLGFYLDTLMGFRVNGVYSDTVAGIREGVRTFLTHPDYRGLFDTVAAHFPNTKSIEEDLRKGFAYYRHYFPQKPIPKIIYFTSGLNSWSAITYGDILGIGLDMYLGPHYPHYAAVGIPVYISARCTPVYIPADAFRAIYREEHPFNPDGQALLHMILERGKEQYFLSKILPDLQDSVRLGFTAAQTEWCRENEGGIYNALVSEGLLYETNLQKIYRFVSDGPASAGFPPEAPGNVGSYLGLRIVESWMDSHDDVTLAELLNQELDAGRFLQESGYKPR